MGGLYFFYFTSAKLKAFKSHRSNRWFTFSYINYTKQSPAQLRDNVELLINAGADASIKTEYLTVIAPELASTYMLHHIANAKLSNRDAFAIIKALFKGGAQKNIRDFTEHTPTQCALRKAHDCTDPKKAARFALRAKFIQLYPGDTLQMRILLDMLVRTCSNNHETATAAHADFRLLKMLFSKQAELIEPFMLDTPKNLHVPMHTHPHPFIRENSISRIRHNVNSIAVLDHRYIANARKWRNGKLIKPRR